MGGESESFILKYLMKKAKSTNQGGVRFISQIFARGLYLQDLVRGGYLQNIVMGSEIYFRATVVFDI